VFIVGEDLLEFLSVTCWCCYLVEFFVFTESGDFSVCLMWSVVLSKYTWCCKIIVFKYHGCLLYFHAFNYVLDFLTEDEIQAKYYQILVIDHFLQEPFLLVHNVYCFSSLNVIFSATRLLPYPPFNQPITLCCKWFPPAMRLLVWKLAIQPIFGLLLVFRHLGLSCELCRSSSASHGPIP